MTDLGRVFRANRNGLRNAFGLRANYGRNSSEYLVKTISCQRVGVGKKINGNQVKTGKYFSILRNLPNCETSLISVGLELTHGRKRSTWAASDLPTRELFETF